MDEWYSSSDPLVTGDDPRAGLRGLGVMPRWEVDRHFARCDGTIHWPTAEDLEPYVALRPSLTRVSEPCGQRDTLPMASMSVPMADLSVGTARIPPPHAPWPRAWLEILAASVLIGYVLTMLAALARS